MLNYGPLTTHFIKIFNLMYLNQCTRNRVVIYKYILTRFIIV